MGEGGVGKTTLVRALKQKGRNDISKDYGKTIFLEIESVYLSNDISDPLMVYDVSGQLTKLHPINIIPDIVLKNIAVILMVFSLDRFISLMSLENWFIKVKEYYCSKNIKIPKIILVGAKGDLPHRIDESLIIKILTDIEEIDDYVEVSSATGTGVDILIRKIHNVFYEEQKNDAIINKTQETIELEIVKEIILKDSITGENSTS